MPKDSVSNDHIYDYLVRGFGSIGRRLEKVESGLADVKIEVTRHSERWKSLKIFCGAAVGGGALLVAIFKLFL